MQTVNLFTTNLVKHEILWDYPNCSLNKKATLYTDYNFVLAR